MKFAEWLPDQDKFENPGLVKAHNVLPGSFYKPLKKLVGQTSPIGGVNPEISLGAYSTKDDVGASLNFAGTAGKIYRLASGTWSDVTRGSGDYGTVGENSWNFGRFGNTILATNRSDNIQKLDTDTENSFDDLGGSPPKAMHMAVVRDFLVLGNLDTGANKVQWSGLNNIEQWTPGQEESDAQVFPEGGPITAMVGGEYGLIFQEYQITRMEYQGPPLNFSFDVIETGIGAIASGSVVRFGVHTYYLSNNGFYVTDGTQSYPIGSEKIDKYFFNLLNENLLYKMTSMVDPINKLVIWSYVAGDSDIPNRLIIYNWDLKRWSEASGYLDGDETVSLDHHLIYSSLSEDYLLEDLDTFGTLAEIETPLDSRFWMGGNLLLSVFDTESKSASFTGDDVYKATIKTGQFEIADHKYSLITQIWPEIDGQVDVKITSLHNHQDTNPNQTGLVGVNSIGFSPFSQSGRYHDFEFSFKNWSRASGYKIKAEAIGEY